MRKLILLALSLSVMLVVVYQSKKAPKRVAESPWVNKLPPAQPPKQEPPKPTEITFDQAVDEIKEADLRKHMNYLCSQELEGRMSGKKGNKLAATYIEQQFASYGCRTKRQRFPVQRMNAGPNNETGDDFSENIIGWIDGTDPAAKREVMVVGAHFDHIGWGPRMSQDGKVGIHPGADDNATGTAVLMEIARAMAKCKPQVKRTTVFISFSGEEMGLIGSKYYCNNPIFPLESPSMSGHIFMLNMDMLGYLNQARLVADFGDTETVAPDLQGSIRDLSGKYRFAKSITGSGSGGSDHASFAAKRVPVCILHTGMHKNYHTVNDTVDRINFSGMTQVAKYATELSWRIGSGPRPASYSGGPLKKSEFAHDER